MLSAYSGMAPAAGKRFLFELGTDEQGSKKTKFALSLPTCRKSGSDYKDGEAKLLRDAFVRMIDTAWKNPELILQTENWMHKRLNSLANKGADKRFETISTLRSLDETYGSSYVAARVNISLGVLEMVCGASPGA